MLGVVRQHIITTTRASTTWTPFIPRGVGQTYHITVVNHVNTLFGIVNYRGIPSVYLPADTETVNGHADKVRSSERIIIIIIIIFREPSRVRRASNLRYTRVRTDVGRPRARPNTRWGNSV